MEKELEKEKDAFIFRRKLMTLEWKYKGDVCILSSIYKMRFKLFMLWRAE
jgi:hypothetical protein